MMEDVFVIEKALMAEIIASLKTLDVRGWDSMDKLVGCVLLLEQAMNAPKPKEETESEEIKLSGETQEE